MRPRDARRHCTKSRCRTKLWWARGIIVVVAAPKRPRRFLRSATRLAEGILGGLPSPGKNAERGGLPENLFDVSLDEVRDDINRNTEPQAVLQVRKLDRRPRRAGLLHVSSL
jgi:hypothetical protein